MENVTRIACVVSMDFMSRVFPSKSLGSVYMSGFTETMLKNRSAMRTWGLMLFVNVLPVLLLSVGILFTNASVWEFNCYK